MSKHFTVERDVIVPMRDGTKLRADVYLPQGEGPFPTLLERTPYDKRNSAEIQLDAPQYFTTHGYAAVIQDTRGRYASEGEFYPFHDDGWGVNRDGYDTVEWCAQQPWCNGKVGTIGGSYSGMTQYRLAPTNPPHLAAVCEQHLLGIGQLSPEPLSHNGAAYAQGLVQFADRLDIDRCCVHARALWQKSPRGKMEWVGDARRRP